MRRLFEKIGFGVTQVNTRGSIDIRYIPNLWGVNLSNKVGLYIADKFSGLVAKFAQPLKFGNTIFLYARKN